GYLSWIWGVLHGDFGHSMIDGSTVMSHIVDRLPNTIELTATAILIGMVVAVPVGVIGALRRGSKTDHALTVVSVAGFAVPQFWMGLMLILIFSVTLEQHGLPWLPSSGAYSPFNGGDVLDRLQHLVLPATVLSFFYVSTWSRFIRSSMLEVLSQDYIRTARAKGMSERRVVYLHGLRNALIPLITLIGLELPGLVSGGLVVEVVFGWPGIGKLAFERALQYDYTTVMGVTFFAAPLFSLAVTHFQPQTIDLGATFAKPGSAHLLGTDELGRDTVTRLIYGGRVTLGVAFLTVAVSLTVGAGVGMLAGYYGGWLDDILMRLVDTV